MRAGCWLPCRLCINTCSSALLVQSCFVEFVCCADMFSHCYGSYTCSWLIRGLCNFAGTADLGHQLQLCGDPHQLPHGSAGSALQQPVTQAGEAEVQARGKGTPQESHCSYQWPGKTSVQMGSWIASNMLHKQHMPDLMRSMFVVARSLWFSTLHSTNVVCCSYHCVVVFTWD